MEIKNYVNKWIASSTIYWKDIYQEIDNLQCVKEEDRDLVKNKVGIVFGKCIGIIGQYLIIHNHDYDIRIQPELVRNIYPTPKFEWGDKVQEVQRSEIKGEIENLFWHIKDNEFKYFIKINGKSKSRRYNPDELEFIKEDIK
jgi:hypothetical protein